MYFKTAATPSDGFGTKAHEQYNLYGGHLVETAILKFIFITMFVS